MWTGFAKGMLAHLADVKASANEMAAVVKISGYSRGPSRTGADAQGDETLSVNGRTVHITNSVYNPSAEPTSKTLSREASSLAQGRRYLMMARHCRS